MKNKAIFGGTFDPIHNGHLHIAYEALYKLKLDKIIFVPSGNPPHKSCNEITNKLIRYEMVNAVVRSEKRFEISSYETDKKEKSYTYDTVEYFRSMYPNDKWYFITGVDCLMNLKRWKNVDKIMKMCTFVVFNRPGYNKSATLKQKKEIEDLYDTKIEFLDIPLLDISSTDIRRLIWEGKNVRYVIPEGVYEIIKKLNLYT